MNNNNLKNYILDNSLKLEFIYQSKEIYVDMFYIYILLCTIVPIERKWFKEINLGEIKFVHISNILKEEVTFEQKHERHFVKVFLRENSINSIITGVLSSSVKYLGHQNFPGNLILKCFREKKPNL